MEVAGWYNVRNDQQRRKLPHYAARGNDNDQANPTSGRRSTVGDILIHIDNCTGPLVR